MQNTKRRR